ncbi:MAG: hypothetical protein AAF202_04875 [Pseudomonadota bacterium]
MKKFFAIAILIANAVFSLAVASHFPEISQCSTVAAGSSVSDLLLSRGAPSFLSADEMSLLAKEMSSVPLEHELPWQREVENSSGISWGNPFEYNFEGVFDGRDFHVKRGKPWRPLDEPTVLDEEGQVQQVMSSLPQRFFDNLAERHRGHIHEWVGQPVGIRVVFIRYYLQPGAVTDSVFMHKDGQDIQGILMLEKPEGSSGGELVLAEGTSSWGDDSRKFLLPYDCNSLNIFCGVSMFHGVSPIDMTEAKPQFDGYGIRDMMAIFVKRIQP